MFSPSSDQAKIEAYIAAHGVTPCPAVGSDDFNALMLQRAREEAAACALQASTWRNYPKKRTTT